jgi:arabinogalactan oligomer/maltooligosaccharide transport system substrate-binding protein
MKKLFTTIIAVLGLVLALTLTSCGKKELTIWVGSECVEFYQAKCDAYIEQYNATHDEAFPTTIKVLGVDAGAAAQQYLNDVEAGPDIFTIPHDNMGKLTAGSSNIYPIQSQSLIDQINNDNPQAFIDVVQSSVQGKSYYFGVPYIAQSLVLYYNADVLTAEDVKTWEGISAKAKAISTGDKLVKAADLLGDDGFNNSFLLLAKYYNAQGQLTTSVKIYENGVEDANMVHGDDTMAALKWGARYFKMVDGSTIAGGIGKAGSSGWETDLKDGYALSLVGGAWNYRAAKAALGSKLGIAVLPQFTITEEDAYGTIAAGTIFQSGSFADCKCFVLKKGSKYQQYLEEIVQYLSSVSMQEEAFAEVANLPAYKNAADEFEAMKADTLDAKLSACQIKMFEYGIAQPFGYAQKYNTRYYSKNTPALIYAWLTGVNSEYALTDAGLMELLQYCESVWSTGETK